MPSTRPAAHTEPPPRPASRVLPLARTAAWTLYLAASVVHVVALALQATDLADASKLTLMPLLFLAALAQAGAGARSSHFAWLAAALWLSWLGDSTGTLLPFLPTLPAMLGFFALAHAAYIVLFLRLPKTPRTRWSAAWIPVWWLGMVLVVAPHAGSLAVAVAVYGVLLGCTAAVARRGPSPALWGGVLFLASDSLLAFWLFMPNAPHWLSPAVMATYCAGQGLLALSTSRWMAKRAALLHEADRVSVS